MSTNAPGSSPQGGSGPDRPREPPDPLRPIEIGRIAFVALAAAAVWFRVTEPLFGTTWLGLCATVVGGYPIFEEAFENLLQRRMTMELSMTIALGAALAIGAALTALVIVFFVLVAEVLEGLTVGRGRRAIRDLLDLLPATVEVRRGEKFVEEGMSGAEPGNVILIRPGARIPADGVVTAGRSFVDQAAITGESMPAEKLPGTPVFAGTINQSGRLEVEVTRVGSDTAFGRIVATVEEARQSKAPIQKTADRLAGYLVYFALAAAVFTFLITRDIRSTISVVIVAGACGIAAGTPLAILGAIGRAARHGAIVKGGIHLEALWRIDTVVLDKTGTLTFGTPEVVGIHSLDGVPENEVLAIAASAEQSSEHPLGRAVVEEARRKEIPLAETGQFEYAPGKGIRSTSKAGEILVGNRMLFEEAGVTVEEGAAGGGGSGAGTMVLVAKDRRLMGAIEVADRLRPEAREAVSLLAEMGLGTILLTGDERSVAEAVGKRLGVDEIGAGLLPEAKLSRIRELTKSGRKVAMVGDGINDAPALAEAQVGIAMGSGTDVARESSDVLLLGNDLVKLVETLRTARWCDRVIRTNFAGTLLVDGAGVILAAFGLLSPLLAAFIHVTSELIFIANSARLLPHPGMSVTAGTRPGTLPTCTG